MQRQSREAIQQIVYCSILILRRGCNAKRYPHCQWKHSDKVNDVVPGDRLAENRSFESDYFVLFITSPTSPTSALSHFECEIETSIEKHHKTLFKMFN